MNNVILVGYMGSGKTTVGKKLSYRLKRTFLDTDREIEREQKRSIPEIFAGQGENGFRRLETEYLKGLLSDNELHVISTGGGMVLREENRMLLQSLGTVVYLRAAPETIWERLQGDTTRPLLQTADPETKIREMMRERAPFYEAAANVTISVDGLGFEEIVDRICDRIDGGA